MTDPKQFPPGWYDTGTGRRQWYDGTRWTGQWEPEAAPAAPTPGSEPAQPKRGRRWLVPVVCGVGGLVLGIIIGSAGHSSPTPAAADNPEVTPAPTVTVTITQTPTPEATATTKPAPPKSSAVGRFPGDGTYVVNTDILPGTYRSMDNSECYWERERGLSGSFGDIIANDNINGQAIVKILKSDKGFKTERCSEWVRIGP